MVWRCLIHRYSDEEFGGQVLIDIFLHLPLREMVQIGNQLHFQDQHGIERRAADNAFPFVELDQPAGEPLPVDPLLELAQEMVGWDDLIIQIFTKEGLAPGFAEMLKCWVSISPSICGNMPIESNFCENGNFRVVFQYSLEPCQVK